MACSKFGQPDPGLICKVKETVNVVIGRLRIIGIDERRFGLKLEQFSHGHCQAQEL